jgi:hypothetical protein
MISRPRALFAALMLVLVACGGGDGDENGQTNAGEPWPQEMIDLYMEGCLQGAPGERAYCSCTIEEIQKRFTVEEFAVFGLSVQSSETEVPAETQERVMEAVNMCLTLIGG